MLKKWQVVFAGVIFLIFLVNSPMAISVEENSQQISYPDGQEIIEARTAHSKMFRTDSKTDTIFISAMPLHFRDGQSKWQDISTDIEAAKEETDEDGVAFGFRSLKNTFQSYLPRSSNGWTRLQSGNCKLSFKLVSSNSNAFNKQDNSTILGCDALPKCDIRFTVRNSALKEDLILKDQRAVKEFEYRIKLDNLSIIQSPDGDLLYKDNNENTVFVMPKLFMYDSKDMVSEDIQVQLIKQADYYRLLIKPSLDWLNNADRVYPVTIDPTTIQINGTGIDPCNGNNGTLVYYLPGDDFVGSTASQEPYSPTLVGGTYYINYCRFIFNKPYVFPYDVTYTVTATASGTSSQFWSTLHTANFSIEKWDPNASSDSAQTLGLIYSTDFPDKAGGTVTKTFTLKGGLTTSGHLGEAVRFKMNNVIYYRFLGTNPWSGNISMTIKCQKESMSPKKPSVKPLSPETPGTSVTLKWNKAIDDWNQDAWKQPPYDSVLLGAFTELTKIGEVVTYKVQYATDLNFTQPSSFVGSINYNSATGFYSCVIPGLLQGNTYYFRVCGVDEEGNPTNMNAWNSLTNPSGPQWSEPVSTKCISPLPSGVPSQPNITGISPSNPIDEEERYYCNSNTPSITWDHTLLSGETASVCFMDSNYISHYYRNFSSGNTAIINSLSDGRYVAYVQITNANSPSLWSNGWRVTVDTQPIVISSVVESITGANVSLKFTSSKEVQVDAYWDLSPTPIIQKTNYVKYDGSDNLAVDLPNVYYDTTKPHYYRLEFRDKANNTYSTGTIQLGNSLGSNVVNTNCLIGQESYLNYQTVDLGRAGVAKVNTNNGNLTVTATDYSIPGRGIPLSLSRFYNSLVDYQGMFGMGWRSLYEMNLQISGQDVIINDPDGSAHKFIYNGAGFNRAAGDFRRVARNADQSYTVTETDGTRYNFSAALPNGTCRLNSIADRFGNTLNLGYDANGFLTSVVEPSGRITARFDYNYYDPFTKRNLVSAIRFTPLETGTTQSRYATFRYQRGRIAEVHYPTDKKIDSIIVEAVVHYTYDSVIGVLSSSKVNLMCGGDEQGGSLKNDTIFGYKATKRSLGAISTYFTKNAGTTRVNYYFDYNGDVTTVTDPRGNKTIFTHYGSSSVNNGQCKSIDFPACLKADGSSADRPASVFYSYDNDYHLITETQKKTVFNPNTGTDDPPRDVVTTYIYNNATNNNDKTGNLESVIVDDGSPALGCKKLTTRITYESEHNGVLTDIKTVTDARGNTTTYNSLYDSGNKLTKITIIPPPTDPSDNYTIIHSFNQYGERTGKDVTVDGASKYYFGYDYIGGMLSKLTNHFGETNYSYTLYGEKNTILDANHVNTNMVIDCNTGLLKAVMAPGEKPSPTPQFTNYSLPTDSPRESYDYDANRNKLAQTDAAGKVSHFEYNELNRLSFSNTLTIQSNCYYDANGNNTFVYDSAGNYNAFTYDAMNRKTQTKDNAGKIQEELEYDSAGRVKARWDKQKIRKTVYYYDSVDNLMRAVMCDANGVTLAITNYYKFDANHNLISYDQNNNLLTKSAPISDSEETGFINTDYQYDALNRVTSISVDCPTNSKYKQGTTYSYLAGQIKEMAITINSIQQIYKYYYDPAMRLDYMTNSAGQKISFDYYDGGQRKHKYIYKQINDPSPFMTVSYSYDPAYLLRHLDYTWGSYYVKMGYNYNTVDKINSTPIDFNLSAPDVAAFLGVQNDDPYAVFNASKALANQSFPVSDSQYTYDNLGRLTSADIYGICQNATRNVSAGYKHEVISFPTADIDSNGNPHSKIITEGNYSEGTNYETKTTSEYSVYNYLNQLTHRNINVSSENVDENKAYQVDCDYDSNGNQTTERFSNELTPRDNSQFGYGFDNQLLWSTIDSAHTKGYANGELYNRTCKHYTYELGGRLLRANTNIYDDTDIYDTGVWTVDYHDYFYYSHDGVIAELHDDAYRTKYFTRLGGELLACNTGSNSNYFYIQNIRGDVIVLVDSSGNVTSIRDYDATGQLMSKAPDVRTDRDPFGFTGGLDGGNGLWKLGARFYDSSKNSFIQQDRYMGDPSDPLSLNRYVYCNMDPVNYVDPTGFNGFSIAQALPYIGTGVLALGGTAIIVLLPEVAIPAIVVAGMVGDTFFEASKDKSNSKSNDKQKNGTPGNNQAQNKQVKDIVNKYKLNKDQQRDLHDDITGQNYSYKEIEEIAKEIAQKGEK